MEARQRLHPSNEDGSKRRPRLKSKDAERLLHLLRGPNCKYRALKIVPVLIIIGALITLLHSPDIYNNSNKNMHLAGPYMTPNFVSRRKMSLPDLRYVSKVDVNWDQVQMVNQKLPKNDKYFGVGLLNFNVSEIKSWKQLIPNAMHTTLNIAYLKKNVTWDTFYPEWIDEEEEENIPKCPEVPDVEAPRKRLDLIAVKLPCQKVGNWSKDVARLHLQLATAKLAAYAKGDYKVQVLFVTECFPLPNLFTCKELMARDGNVWLYAPNLNVLREKVHLPVGSCELALPFETERVYSGNAHREAYATILHSAHLYVCGAIAAAKSIRMAGSTRDLVILVDETISAYHRSGLEVAGWKVRTIQRIRNPKAEKDAYNEWNYSKFRLWQLTDYDKIIFIDADMLVLRNIDFLFSMPEISATGNNGSLFNSGVMVIEPSNCTFQLLMEHINEIESYNGGDQGYLNEIFTWWHRIPKHMNYLKHFWVGDADEKRRLKTRLFGGEPPVLYVLHYLGIKPWHCFREYDCNWNVEFLQEFASDVAHARWWKVHDAMPEDLQQFCLLRSKQKAQLEWDRIQAEKANYSDEHWRVEVKDPRLKICTDNLCSWKSMLRHWGETNWTDEEFSVPSAPALPIVKLDYFNN